MSRPAQGRRPSAAELVALWTRDPAPWRHFWTDEEWNAILDDETLLRGVEKFGVTEDDARALRQPIEVARAYWDRVLLEARKRRAR